MNNFFKLSRFWTFEQVGSRQDQMFKYLGQVNQEIFKSSMHRNIIGTISSFPIHYYLDPVISSCLLLGVGVVHFHSVYKYKQCTKILGYYKDQKHLLKGIYSQPESNEQYNATTNQFNDDGKFQSQFSNSANNNSFTKSSSEQPMSNYEKYLSQQQKNSQSYQSIDDSDKFTNTGQIKEDQIRYIQVENTEERMKYYNRQLFCMGILQGIFLGSYTDIWNEGYIYATHFAVIMNSVLNGYLFQHFYQTNYNMTNLKALLIGTITPLPLSVISPVIFNNGIIQSNLLKQAQKLFLSENINQDPSLFIIHRTGVRLFGLILFYLMTLVFISGDDEDEDNDNEDDKKNKSSLNWVIQFKVDDGSKIKENLEALRKFNDKDEKPSKKKEEEENKPIVTEDQNKK